MTPRFTTSPVRRRFLQFLVAVAAVHIVAITLFYATGIARAEPARQRMFAWIWMAATVLLIAIGLQRIKRARGRSGARESERAGDRTT